MLRVHDAILQSSALRRTIMKLMRCIIQQQNKPVHFEVTMHITAKLPTLTSLAGAARTTSLCRLVSFNRSAMSSARR